MNQDIDLSNLNLEEEVNAVGDFNISGVPGGPYALTWPDLNIEVFVNRIEEKHHVVSGEVKIISTRPVSAGVVTSGVRENLSSAINRERMRKNLLAKDPTVDWYKFVEQLCGSVITEYRRGSPLKVLTGTADVKAQQRWLVEPIVLLNAPTTIYGTPGTGKSFFAQFIAVLVDAGMSFAGLSVEPCPGQVLMLDWETEFNELENRTSMIRRGLGLEGEAGIRYRHMSQGLADDFEAIKDLVVENDIKLLIVDSVGMAVGGPAEESGVVNTMYSALRNLGDISVILVDHANNEGKLFGSIYKKANSRLIWEAKHKQAINSNVVDFGLFHIKGNNVPFLKPMGYKIAFTPDEEIRFTYVPPGDSDLSEYLPLSERIDNVIKQRRLPDGTRDPAYGPKNIRDIHLALGGDDGDPECSESYNRQENTVKRSYVQKALNDGKKKGRFVQLDDGTKRWGVVSRVFAPQTDEGGIEGWELTPGT